MHLPRMNNTTKMAAAAVRAGIVILASLLISQCASAQTFNAVSDWSSQSNPNGVWSYGYLTSWGAPFTLYTSEGDCGTFGGPGFSNWFLFSDSCNPHIGHNDTNKEICVTTACAPPQYLVFHPGPNGELSVLRWTSPAQGKYLLQVKFEGLDWFFPTSTYVYIVKNSKSSFLKAPITSYKLPLSYNPPASDFSAGDTLDFMVDWGKDGSYIGDSTGVQVKITSLSKH
jgi:hypothetical protein